MLHRSYPSAIAVMVYREISIMKLLRHPNIIRLYEVVDTEKVLFLIMEYASGGEVLDFIVAHGRLGEKEARRFFRQILSAIAYDSLTLSLAGHICFVRLLVPSRIT